MLWSSSVMDPMAKQTSLSLPRVLSGSDVIAMEPAESFRNPSRAARVSGVSPE